MRRLLPASLPVPGRAPRRTGPPPLPSRALLVVPQTSAAPSPGAVALAVEAAGGGPATVLTVLRIHGSGLGVPHPGLLPNAAERERGRAAVAAAIAALEAEQVRARGEIAVTRAEARAIVRTARAIGAATVILDLPESRGLRGLIEGDLAAQLRRRLRGDAKVIVSQQESQFPNRRERHMDLDVGGTSQTPFRVVSDTWVGLPKMDIPGTAGFISDTYANPEGSAMCGGFFELHHTDQPLLYEYEYDEMKIVLEGEFLLENKETGQSLVARARDVIFFPKGSKIHFSTPDRALAFYVGHRSAELL